MLAGSPLGRSKRSAPPRGGARSRPAGRGAGTGLAPERAGGGGERLLGLWWPEAPGPRGRRLWLRRPRPKDPPRLGLRRVRAPLPPPPGRCPVKSVQRIDGICPAVAPSNPVRTRVPADGDGGACSLCVKARSQGARSDWILQTPVQPRPLPAEAAPAPLRHKDGAPGLPGSRPGRRRRKRTPSAGS